MQFIICLIIKTPDNRYQQISRLNHLYIRTIIHPQNYNIFKAMSLKDFVVMDKLGTGSFASVYKARRLVDQQIYALKKIDMKALGPRQKHNALNEIRLLACLSSPYIIGFCDSFFQQKLDLLCIAMEYADGGDLFKLIEKHKKQRTLMPEVQIWKAFIHLLYGLNQLHTKSILHRDLKSQNVFIANGVYKIGDMNVSKILKSGLAKTQTGTPYYASPEVWNDQPYNQKSDIWSLGCILYEITSLNPPFEASSMQRLFDNVTKTATPKIPKNYSRQIQSIVEQCLQKNPNNRPSTKQLLQNATVKLYENLLIEFKPKVDISRKQSLLRTIYMPSQKNQLKSQLPQSNYKNSSKVLREEIINKSLQKLTENEQIERNQKSFKKQVYLRENQNFIETPRALQDKKVDNINIFSEQKGQKNSISKNSSSKRQRNRVQSCKIFKENKGGSSAKKISNKENLIQRAQFIMDSQKKLNQKVPPPVPIKNLKQKQNTKNKSAKNGNQKKQDQNELKYLNIIETLVKKGSQQLKPKKLIFQQSPTKIETKIVLEENSDKMPEISQQTVIQIKESVLRNSQLQKTNLICKSPYLQTMKNVSGISQNDHLQYNFGLNTGPSTTVQNAHKVQLSKYDQNQRNVAQKFRLQQQEVIKNVQIVLEINQNYCKKQNIRQIKQISNELKTSVALSVQIIYGFMKNNNLRHKMFGWNGIRHFYQQIQLKARQQQIRVKIYSESQKIIQDYLVKQKIQHQKQTDEQKQVGYQKTPVKPATEQKRARCKSMPKTQKSKNSNLFIGKKLDFNEISNKKQFQQSAIDKKQNKIEQNCIMQSQGTRKKIFPEQGINETNHLQQMYRKLKQMALIPSFIEPNKQRPPINNPAPVKNIFPQPSLSNRKVGDFDLKKRKIFQEQITTKKHKGKQFSQINPIYQINDKLQRINLQKKLKKYMNV